MKRTIFVVISSLLLLGLVLAGCTGEGYGTGKQVGVWPNGNYAWPAYFGLSNYMSILASGLNWTPVEYPTTADFTIPDEYKTAWASW